MCSVNFMAICLFESSCMWSWLFGFRVFKLREASKWKWFIVLGWMNVLSTFHGCLLITFWYFSCIKDFFCLMVAIDNLWLKNYIWLYAHCRINWTGLLVKRRRELECVDNNGLCIVVCICCCMLTLLVSLTGWSFRTSSTVEQATSWTLSLSHLSSMHQLPYDRPNNDLSLPNGSVNLCLLLSTWTTTTVHTSEWLCLPVLTMVFYCL